MDEESNRNYGENKYYLTATAGVGAMDAGGETALVNRTATDDRHINGKRAQGCRIELSGIGGQGDKIGQTAFFDHAGVEAANFSSRARKEVKGLEASQTLIGGQDRTVLGHARNRCGNSGERAGGRYRSVGGSRQLNSSIEQT